MARGSHRGVEDRKAERSVLRPPFTPCERARTDPSISNERGGLERRSGEPVASAVLPAMLQCVAAYPDGAHIVVGDAGGAVDVIELVGVDR